MASLQFEFHQRLEGSPRLGYIVRGFADLLNAQLVPEDRNLLADDHCAIVAVENGQPIGFVTLRNDTGWNDSLWIVIAWVDPTQRRRGVFHSLFSEVKKLAERNGARSIDFGTRPHNSQMRAAAEHVGAKEDFMLYRFEVES